MPHPAPTNSPTNEVVITGMGLVTPLGDTPEALHDALCAGKRAMRPVSLFPTTGLGAHEAAEVDFDHRHYFGRANVRPLDRTARLATAAAQQALDTSGWTSEMRAEHDVGLVLGTMFGGLDTVTAFDLRTQTAGPKYAKPLDFANSVINAAAGQVAIWHDLRGVNSTVTGGLTAGVQAITYAADLIRLGRADAVLAGGAEELSFPSLHGFHHGGRLAGGRSDQTPHAVPFAPGRNGFVLGEGAALLMLESAERATARGATVLGRVRGWASGFDCSRGNDGQNTADTVARVVRLALDDADLAPHAVDAISCGANGSPAGDLHEAQGLAAALGDPGHEAAGCAIPVAAVKAMLGECLGASAALQASVLVEAMRRDALPGISGLDERDADVPLHGLSAETLTETMNVGLVEAMGLDGTVAAVVLSR